MLSEAWFMINFLPSGLQFKYDVNAWKNWVLENQNFLFFVSPLQEALTPQKCIHHIIVRGLVRIRCVREMERILYFMTRKGLINTGILSVSPDQYLLPKEYHNVSCYNNPYIISAIKLHGTCHIFFCSGFFTHYLSFQPFM